MNRTATTFAALCTFAVIAIVLGVRWFGPHDLYEKDQPKTLAYTADIVVNGRFALPRDVIYQPATKPPLYNWIDAAVIKTTGVWTEWTLKFPSILGVLTTGGIVFAMTRRATKNAGQAVVIGLLAAGIWFTFGSNIRHGSVLRMSYLARPDMLLCALLTGAWACFIVAIERPTNPRTWRWAIGGWLCVTAAALTKGPAALMPLAFALIYPLLAVRRHRFYTVNLRSAEAAGGSAGGSPTIEQDGGHERLRSVYARLWLPVGLLIVLIGVGGWATLAYHQDPGHVRGVIWGAEVAGRLMDKSPEGFQSKPYESVMWFVTKAQPWGAIAAGGLLAVLLVPHLRRVGAAPAVYLAIVLIGLSLPAGKRMDYLLPAYPAAAVLIAVVLADLVESRVLGAAAVVGLLGVATYEGLMALIDVAHHRAVGRLDVSTLGALAVFAGVCLLIERRRRVPLALLCLVPLLLAATLGRQFLTKFHEVQGQWSNRAVAFVADVRRHVRPDEKLLVLVRGKHPLTTLLGRHPGSYLTPADLAAADFVILPEQPDLPAEALSAPLPMGFAQIEDRPTAVLGLYRKVPLERLVAVQREIATWTDVENPYHEAGTVFRED